MAKTLDEALREFGEDDITVKLCRNLFQVTPGAPEFVLYRDVDGAVARVAPGAGVGAAQVNDAARGEKAQAALWIAGAMDKADVGLAVASGVSNLLAFFGGSKQTRRTFESDPQQAADAALKLLGLCYMVHLLFPGDLKDKVSSFNELPAGREALLYTAVIEVALPFADNLVEGAVGFVPKLMNASGSATSRMAQFAGSGAVEQSRSMLEVFTAPIEGALAQVAGHIGPITDRLKGIVPRAFGVTDSVTGALATGADALPVWGLLGGRLTAEACVKRAMAKSS